MVFIFYFLFIDSSRAMPRRTNIVAQCCSLRTYPIVLAQGPRAALAPLHIFLKFLPNALLQRVCLLRGTVCVHDRTFNLISSDSGLFQRVFSAQKHDIQQYTHSAVDFVFNPGFTLYHSAFPDPINIQSFSFSTLSTSLIFRFDLVAKTVC